MNDQMAIQTLKKEAKTNPVADAVFHVFAQRQRARHQVTVRALFYKMNKEGFTYTRQQYGKVLKLIGNLGFGRVEHDKVGDVKALKDIRVTLQSLGEAILRQEKTAVETFNRRNRFTALASSVAADLRIEEAVKPKLSSVGNGKALAQDKQVLVYPYRAASNVSITLTIAGKPIILPIPGELSPEEIAALIEHLRVVPRKSEKDSKNKK